MCLKLMYTLFEMLFLSNKMRKKYNFCCVWSRRHWESIAHVHCSSCVYTNVVVKLSFDEHKWLLKCYWNVKNVVEVQRRWRVEFGKTPPTRITIRTRDKFEVDGTVQDVLKVGAVERDVPVIMRVLMQLCRFLHDLQRSHWVNVLVRLVSRNPVFIEFWTIYQWYSISNNLDCISLYSKSLLGVFCGRRWAFWTCTGLRKFKE